MLGKGLTKLGTVIALVGNQGTGIATGERRAYSIQTLSRLLGARYGVVTC